MSVQWQRRMVLLLALTLFSSQAAKAEDSDMFRPYIHFRSAEFNTAWGVLDGWGFGVGANFNRYFGAELAFDAYEIDLEDARFGVVGEQAMNSLVPQVRVRYPIGSQRWVPYALGGVGVAFLQFNDPKPVAFGREIQAEGARLAVNMGLGLEYFLADNVTFSLEAKYHWVQPLDVTIEGERRRRDFSAPTVTMGLRAYFFENQPSRLVEAGPPGVHRLYFGARFGGSVLTGRKWAHDVRLEPEESAIGDVVNHFGGLALGANFGRHWGVELAGDFTEYALDVDPFGVIGEYSVYTAVPHLRLRVPLKRGRIVPYVMGGMGIVYAEFNDRKPGGVDLPTRAAGVHPAVSAGAGVEYFFARNFSMNFDTRWLYTWNHELDVVDRFKRRGDFSSVNFHLGFRVYLVEFGRDQN
jgi:opacity protein-like surface antigen